jgi:hypothetical protein
LENGKKSKESKIMCLEFFLGRFQATKRKYNQWNTTTLFYSIPRCP